VDNTRDVTQYCEQDVDQEVGIATPLEEDPNWWEKDGEDDFADVAMNSGVNDRRISLRKPPQQNRCLLYSIITRAIHTSQ
jgi:hypothetical protein